MRHNIEKATVSGGHAYTGYDKDGRPWRIYRKARGGLWGAHVAPHQQVDGDFMIFAETLQRIGEKLELISAGNIPTAAAN